MKMWLLNAHFKTLIQLSNLMKELLESDNTTKKPKEEDWNTFLTENGELFAIKISENPRPLLLVNKWVSQVETSLETKWNQEVSMSVKIIKEPIIVEKTLNLLQEKFLHAQEKNKLLKTVTLKKSLIAITNLTQLLFVWEQEMQLVNLKKKIFPKQVPLLWENCLFLLFSSLNVLILSSETMPLLEIVEVFSSLNAQEVNFIINERGYLLLSYVKKKSK